MNRVDAVHNLAKRKVKQYGLIPPVDLYPIYKDINVQIIEKANELGVEAYSILDDNPKVIINPEVTYYKPRRQFTLAHELGHIFIPWHNGDTKCDIDNHYIKIGGKRMLDTQELEANIFASDILMPVEWLKEIINSNQFTAFDSLVAEISKQAKTSIMACFYALEQVLPSGYIYFVKKQNAEWWSFFSSKNSYTVNWFSFNEDRMEFIEALALEKEVYKIGIYDVILYKMISCPNKKDLRDKYDKDTLTIRELTERISDGVPLRVLPFLDTFLSAFSDQKFAAFLFRGDELIRRIIPEEGPLRKLYVSNGIPEIIEIANLYGFKFEQIELGNDICLLYILEKQFQLPHYRYSDPNLLLRKICADDKSLLQSINGVMSLVNSQYGKKSLEELYNLCKYKFISNQRYKDVVCNPEFDKYIVNKLVSMKKY